MSLRLAPALKKTAQRVFTPAPRNAATDKSRMLCRSQSAQAKLAGAGANPIAPSGVLPQEGVLITTARGPPPQTLDEVLHDTL